MSSPPTTAPANDHQPTNPYTMPAPRRGKLVRDNVPDLIRATGAIPLIRTATPGEYRALLGQKLREEVDELLAAHDPAELADVQEVLLALAEDLGVGTRELQALREQKSQHAGGFAERLVWEGNTDMNVPAAAHRDLGQ